MGSQQLSLTFLGKSGYNSPTSACRRHVNQIPPPQWLSQPQQLKFGRPGFPKSVTDRFGKVTRAFDLALVQPSAVWWSGASFLPLRGILRRVVIHRQQFQTSHESESNYVTFEEAQCCLLILAYKDVKTFEPCVLSHEQRAKSEKSYLLVVYSPHSLQFC